MQQPDVLQAKRVLSIQMALTLALSAFGSFFSRDMALSLLLGGAVCTLANGVFAWWVFRRYRAQDPGSLVMRFYGAEFVKIVLILGLFATAFTLMPGLEVPALLGAYFVVQVLPALIASGRGAAR
jgi:ATP synthase protein I